MADDDELDFPECAGTVLAWFEALGRAEPPPLIWIALDEQLRLILAQQWLYGPGRVHLPDDHAQWDTVADLLARVERDHPLYSKMINDYVAHWRTVYRMLNYRPAVLGQRDFVGPDLELVVVTSDDYAGTFEAHDRPIPGHSFIMHLVDGEWFIRAQARRLSHPGWPPTEETIVGLRIDGVP